MNKNKLQVFGLENTSFIHNFLDAKKKENSKKEYLTHW